MEQNLSFLKENTMVKSWYIDKILHEFSKRLEKKQSIVVAVDGMCAAGKSTFAKEVQQHVDCNIISMDDFFLQPHMRTRERLQEIGGNVDYERFYSQVIRKLHAKETISYQMYDCKKQMLLKECEVASKPITIIEGVYCHHPYFQFKYDYSICFQIEAKLQKNRILKRNGTDMLKRFVNEWIPMEHNYLNTYEIQKSCDLLIKITGGEENFISTIVFQKK